MKKVAVVYWSGTGNTEAMADLIAQGVRTAGGEADLVQAADFDSSKLDGYDAFAFGCPAMGDEELDEGEVEPFVEELEKSVSGKKVALFGSYDWGDGEWMRKWEERMKEAGAEVVGTVIANNEPGDEDQANLAELAKKLV